MGTGSPRPPTGPDFPQEPIDQPKQAPVSVDDSLGHAKDAAHRRYRLVLGELMDTKIGLDFEKVHEEVVEIAPGETEPKAESM